MKSSAGPVEPDGSYEVERIIDIRASKARGTEFLIKWRFYEDEHNTWEPEGLLDNCPLVLSAFKKAGGRSLSKRVSPASPSTSLAADVAAKRGKAAHGGKKAAQQEGEGMAAGKAAQLTRAGGGEEAALELNWLERLPPRRLKPLCEEKGLPVSGNSEALARRLRESGGLGVPQLKALCAAEGLVKQGTKAEIARRLCDKLLPKAGGPESGGAAEQPKGDAAAAAGEAKAQARVGQAAPNKKLPAAGRKAKEAAAGSAEDTSGKARPSGAAGAAEGGARNRQVHREGCPPARRAPLVPLLLPAVLEAPCVAAGCAGVGVPAAEENMLACGSCGCRWQASWWWKYLQRQQQQQQ